MNSAEISTLITHGRAYKSGSFLFKVLENKAILDVKGSKKVTKTSLKAEKPAFLAPKKVFKTAVLRNKARRRARAAYIRAKIGTILEKSQNKSIFIGFMLNSAVLEVRLDDLSNEIKHVLQKSGIIGV